MRFPEKDRLQGDSGDDTRRRFEAVRRDRRRPGTWGRRVHPDGSAAGEDVVAEQVDGRSPQG